MTEDAADLVSQVNLLNFPSPIGFDAISQLLRKERDSRLFDITEIKKHPFFEEMQVPYLMHRKSTHCPLTQLFFQ